MIATESWVLAYLLNSLWQVPVVFAAAWVASRGVQRLGAQAVHRVWVAALMGEMLLPAVSFPRLAVLRGIEWLAKWLATTGQTASSSGVSISIGAATTPSLTRLPQGVLDALLAAYACSLLYFAGRLALGIRRTWQMQRDAEPVPLDTQAALQWKRMERAFCCPGTELRMSPLVPGPVTAGFGLGVVLVPPAFLDHLPEEDFTALLAHEFAHIRRRDFVKNLVHSLLTLPVAYHPLLWLTRRRVAETREMVCDQIAAEAVAGRDGYARSLLRLAGRMTHLLADRKPVKTLHAIGIFDANLFERRLMNLTKRGAEVRGVRRLAMVALCGALGMAAAGSAVALRMEVPAAQSQGVASTAPHEPVKVDAKVMAATGPTKVVPVYPPAAKEQKITGAVVLKAVISKEGTIENLQVASGPEELRTSALDAVRQWKYKPYLLNGEPVPVETTITVNYSLTK